MNNKLINDNENVKATIGYGYLKEIISGTLAESATDFILGGITNSTLNTLNNISKTFGIVTDKRVYCFGKTYESINGRIKSAKGRKVINIEDITGTSIIKARKPWMLLTSIITTICWLLAMIIDLARFEFDFEWYFERGGFTSLLPLIVPIVFVVLFVVSRTNHISIEYAGGSIRLQTYMESEASIENFQNTIIQLKDSIKDGTIVNKVELNVNQSKDAVEELKRAQKMLEDGLINEEDYSKLKSKILGI